MWVQTSQMVKMLQQQVEKAEKGILRLERFVELTEQRLASIEDVGSENADSCEQLNQALKGTEKKQSQLSTLTASVDNVRKSVDLCGDRTKKVEDRIDSVGKDCSQIQQQISITSARVEAVERGSNALKGHVKEVAGKVDQLQDAHVEIKKGSGSTGGYLSNQRGVNAGESEAFRVQEAGAHRDGAAAVKTSVGGDKDEWSRRAAAALSDRADTEWARSAATGGTGDSDWRSVVANEASIPPSAPAPSQHVMDNSGSDQRAAAFDVLVRDVAMAVEDDRDQLAPNLVPLMSVGGRHSDNEQAVLPGTFHVHAAGGMAWASSANVPPPVGGMFEVDGTGEYSVCVRNLTPHTSTEILWRDFIDFGAIHRVDRLSPKTAAVVFASETSAIAAVSHAANRSRSEFKWEVEIMQDNDENDELPTGLYLCDLPPVTTEEQLWKEYGEFGILQSCRLVRQPRYTYGFVNFTSHAYARKAMAAAQKKSLAGRVAYARRLKAGGPTSSLYIRQLPATHMEEDVRQELQRVFSAYGVVESVFVYGNRTSRYGFVNFDGAESARAAKTALNGTEILGSVIEMEFQQGNTDRGGGNRREVDEATRHLYVGNLDASVTSEDLSVLVGMDAEVDLKKFRDHAYAFVKFVSVEAAVIAKQRMERMAFGSRVCKVGFAKGTPSAEAVVKVDEGVSDFEVSREMSRFGNVLDVSRKDDGNVIAFYENPDDAALASQAIRSGSFSLAEHNAHDPSFAFDGDAANCRSIWVMYRLDKQFSHNELIMFFKPYGNILSINNITRRCFAFIDYDTPQSAMAAITAYTDADLAKAHGIVIVKHSNRGGFRD